ncbi:MAG: FHA domain-containing protein [bacterium]
MIYRLIILSGDRRGEQITLTREPMIIGRAATCEIRLSDPEIALSHAEIAHPDDGIFIRDLGSMNRLLINNREVHEAHLKHGDVVEVGHTRFLIQAYVQAEVERESEAEDQEEKANRRKPWIFGGGMILLVGFLLIFIPRCEHHILAPRVPPVKPAPVQRPQPTALPEVKPPTPAVSNALPPPETVKKQPVETPRPAEPRAAMTVKEPPPAEPVVIKPVITPPPEPTPEKAPPREKANPASAVIAASEKELEDATRVLSGIGTTRTTNAILTPVPISPPATNLIKIASVEINKFPETDQFREMRLLTIRLIATELQKELSPEAVKVEVIFVNQDTHSGQLIPASPQGTPANVSVQGKWLATEQKTAVASYVVLATQPPTVRTSRYYGFHISVYYQGILQAELSQPRDLPATFDSPAPEGGSPPPAP